MSVVVRARASFINTLLLVQIPSLVHAVKMGCASSMPATSESPRRGHAVKYRGFLLSLNADDSYQLVLRLRLSDHASASSSYARYYRVKGGFRASRCLMQSLDIVGKPLKALSVTLSHNNTAHEELRRYVS